MKTKWIPFYLAVLILTSCQPPSVESGVVIDSSEPTKTQPQPTSSDDTGGTEQEQSLFEITENYLVFQIGNNAPAFLLVTEPSQSLPDNHIGGWTGGYDLYNNPDFFYENGFKRIRIGALFGPDQVGWPIGPDTLSEEVDDTITEYAENSIKLILTTPTGSGLPFPPNFQNQAQVDTYLEYLAFVASHFKGRIAYYEILNEPLYMSPKDYVKIAEMAVEVIREIDPDAKIIIGAVCGDWLNDFPGYGVYQRSVLNFMWFFELIQSFNFKDVQVDGISWHPLYDNLPSDPYYQTYPEIIRS
ncbi:MAG: glycoside hydrolase family 5 protein, partial [Anaerolineales bacterium]|nr:glycoside hydrolase family 5 protein [Anaerolineales bacterium]